LSRLPAFFAGGSEVSDYSLDGKQQKQQSYTSLDRQFHASADFADLRAGSLDSTVVTLYVNELLVISHVMLDNKLFIVCAFVVH